MFSFASNHALSPFLMNAGKGYHFVYIHTVQTALLVSNESRLHACWSGQLINGGWLRNAVKQPEVAGHHLAELIRWGHSVTVGPNCGTSKKTGGTDGSAPPRVLRGTHATRTSTCLLVHELFLNHITIRTIAANLNDDLAELVNGEMAGQLGCKEGESLLQFESCIHATCRQIAV